MNRIPIASPEPRDVILIQLAPVFQELLPDYQYQFQNTPQSAEAAAMYQSLVDFLETNSELALSNIEDKDEYKKGFKRAIALVRLWIDSMYLDEKHSHQHSHQSTAPQETNPVEQLIS